MQTTSFRRRWSVTIAILISITATICGPALAKDKALNFLDRKDVTCAETGMIACGQTVTGTLNSATDCGLSDGTFVDFYEFEGSSGDEVRIDLRSSEFDTYLFLINPDETNIQDNNGGNGTNSRIITTLQQNGTHALAVNGFQAGDEGDYNMTLTCPNQGGGGGNGYMVNKDTSGSWFPPAFDGQGWKIEILDNNTALLYWFTYPPANMQGSMGDQAWMIGVGTIDGDTITFDLIIPTGPTFGPDFDPDDLVPNEWGTFTIRFTSENEAEAEFDGGPAGFGGGSFLDIDRLTSITSNTQTVKSGPKMGMPTNMGPGISGSWFDPSHDGEGWTIEVINENTVLVYWFTYDELGRQSWNIGIGKLVGNRLFVDFPVETTGTAFGSGFDSNDISNPKWGSYVFLFDEDCNNGKLGYMSDKGMGADLFNLQRITSLQGVPCQGFNPNAPSDNTVATNPGDPLVLKSERPDGKDIDVFGQRDNNGLANNIGQIKSKDTDDKDVSIQVGVDNRPEDIMDEDSGTTISVEDTPDGFVLTTVTSDGEFSTQIQVTNALMQLKQMQEAQKAGVSTGPKREGRVQAVFTPGVTEIPDFTKGATDSQIQVRRCGAPVNDAFVDVQVSGVPGGPRVFSGYNNGQGVFTVTYPTAAASSSAPPSSQQCGRVVEVFGQSCDDTLADLTANEIAGACLLVAGSFDPFSEESAGIQGETFMACIRGLTAVVDYCGISGLTADDAAMGGLNPNDYVCDNVNDTVDNALDNLTSNVTLTPVATLPGRGSIIGQSRSAPASGPFPDFTLNADGDVEIASFTTIPGDPQPGQSYEARAELDCANEGTEMIISVTGTDGFSDSDSCVFINGGSGSCSLFVPGGGQGVRDTITVEVVNGPTRTISIVF